jgi:phosphatidylserine synthase 2
MPIKKLGAFTWLSVAICVVEVLICIKFGQGMISRFFSLLLDSPYLNSSFTGTGLYKEPMPQWVLWFWLCFALGLLGFLVTWSLKSYLGSHQEKMSTVTTTKKSA